HNNLGNVYTFRKKEYLKGIAHYKKSLVFSEKTDTEIERAYLNLNIASAYFSIPDYKKDYEYLKQTEKAVTESDEVEAKISMYSLLGSYYTYTKEYDKAEKAFKQSLYYCNQDKPELVETHAVEVYDDF